ncbi:MAG: response regulator, partial [Phycisphaeraceae bacterium]|nr:response regulator [Phycisphaeraceae bacterium]
QIILNLITNASEAIGEESGVIALSTRAVEYDRAALDDLDERLCAGRKGPMSEGVYASVEITDTGCGMDADTMGKIFDPFFTTKFVGRGLGMSAVLGIVRGHRGAILVRSEPGRGTTFEVLFPASASIRARARRRVIDKGSSTDWRGAGTILVVDDDENVRIIGREMLARMGFSVLEANDGREAVGVFADHVDEIVCVLLDLTMPGLDGEQAFEKIRRIDPGAPVILCSGYCEQDATRRFAGKGLSDFLQKPFRME